MDFDSDAKFIACIPVRDEQAHISLCLEALDGELEGCDAVVLVANGCRDRTVDIAIQRLTLWKRRWLLIDCTWKPGTGSASLARRLAMDVAGHCGASSLLFSVDGDTIVQPGLRNAYMQEFDRGYDLVCGRIGFIASETAGLPEADPAHEAVIREYREMSRFIEALIFPDENNPWPHHGNIGGANFALRADAYQRIGGLPTPPSGEDRALRRLCQAHDLRIRYSDGPRVETSCRLFGRASGGLSDELRRNRTETDPVVDELLEPPEQLLLRLRSRLQFRSASDAQKGDLLKALILPQAAVETVLALPSSAGWQMVEDTSAMLQRTRMRLSDLVEHLPGLRQMLSAVEEAQSENRESLRP
ncbi:hypothetical protein GCM10016234_27960 [Tianweitania populi]|uniref:Glycosyltransferase n=2 Tax=Tianweitania populi TaxID=1607949 RepID=A0A8J3DWP0_9HYPH|nr:hypothetical protein GCM10016234_27960 [Tianweitania populi]